jgi:PAS domain S-box-containing protein
MKRRRTTKAATPTTLRRLRRRLQEAEDTLDAIRQGHVEALVVRANGEETLFTLRSADHPYRLMVEQMREGAVTIGADGIVLYCNSRFAELIGTAPERIIARPFDSFVAPDDHPRLEALLGAATYRGELQVKTAGGAMVPAQLSSAALTIDGVRTIAVVVTDLTHERTARSLRDANRLKDEFLATLSHELRTPLNVILGWTRMLLAGHLGEAARMQALQLIDRNAKAQAQLVNDLVDMSRVTTGKLRLELEDVPLVPTLEAALASLRPAADAKGLRLVTTWSASGLTVHADPTRLQQIVWNLLSNAVKFTPDGGRIDVRASLEGGLVRIEVTDTGIGIAPAFLPHVFDRFRQADGGTTRRYGGLGLGLAIVNDLVRLHGGTVEGRSDGDGRGSTFVVTLRASEAPVAPREQRARARASSSLAGQRIVLVEDHDDSRDMMTQALQNAGAAVVGFPTARAALPALAAVGPSVIVADIGLPGEDGYAFMRTLRRHPVPSIRSVPAIAVTAYGAPADRDEALAAGFQLHLSKPVELAHLVDAVNDVTRRPRRKARR